MIKVAVISFLIPLIASTALATDAYRLRFAQFEGEIAMEETFPVRLSGQFRILCNEEVLKVVREDKATSSGKLNIFIGALVLANDAINCDSPSKLKKVGLGNVSMPVESYSQIGLKQAE